MCLIERRSFAIPFVCRVRGERERAGGRERRGPPVRFAHTLHLDGRRADAQKGKINRSRLNFEKMCVLFIYYLGCAHKRLLTLGSRVCECGGKKRKASAREWESWREREKGAKSSKSYTPPTTATKNKIEALSQSQHKVKLLPGLGCLMI